MCREDWPQPDSRRPSPASPAVPMPMSPSRSSGPSSAARSPTPTLRAHVPRRLCRLPPPGRRAAHPDRPGRMGAGAVPRADAGLQGRGDAAAGAADGPRAGRARRRAPPSSARPRATPAARRSRRSATATTPTSSSCFPEGRVSPIQQRQMTTAGAANVHAHRGRGHLRRLPGDREGDVQQRAVPRADWRSPASTRSTGRASSRQIVYYFTAAVALGAPRPAGLVHRADRQFRRHLRRLRRQAHGPADRPAGDRHQRQRHPGAHAGERALRAARRSPPPPRRRWTSRSRRISSGCCSRPTAATRPPSPA